MSDYTPTMAELKDYATSYSAIASEAEWDRALAAHDAAKRAEWEAEGEHVFIEGYGMYHAEFGGIGGDVTRLGLTREAWKAMGEPDVVAVSFAPVPDTGAEDEFAPGECDGSGTCTASIHIHGCFTPHRSDQCDSPDEYGHTDTGAES